MGELLQNLELEEKPEDQEIVDQESSIEDDLLDADDEGDAIDQTSDKLDDITDDADTLEDVAIAMEAALSSGKINPELLSFTRAQISRIEDRWKLPKSPIASMESFETDEAAALKASLEGLGDLLTGIWDSIAEGFRAIRRGFKNLLIKIFDASAKIGKEAREVLGRAKSSNAVGGGKVSFSNKGLYIDGGSPTPKKLLEGMATLHRSAEFALSKEDNKLAKQINDVCMDVAKAVVAGQDEGYLKVVKEGITGIQSAFKKLAEGITGTSTTLSQKQSGVGLDVWLSGEFPGGKTVKISDATVRTAWFVGIQVLTNPAATAVAGVSNAFFRTPINYVVQAHDMTIGDFRTKTPRQGNYVAMSSKDTAALMQHVVDLCDIVYGYKRAWEEREGAEERHFEAIQKVVGNPTGWNPFRRRAVTTVAAASQTVWRKTMSFDKDFMAYILKTCRLCIMYGKASLKGAAE